MDDRIFANELIERLNRLCEDNAAKSAILALMDSKVDVGTTLDHHPTCQVSTDCRMGVFGLLNGLAGVIGHGPRAQWGLICAGYESDIIEPGTFVRFYRTEEFPDVESVPTRSPLPVDHSEA